MIRSFALAWIVVGAVASASVACTSKSTTFFSCSACLVDDTKRCASYTPECGDSSEQMPSEAAAKDALCDGLTIAELARRPTPEGFKPTPWTKNACYDWPADAFAVSCTRFEKKCDGVPIH